MIKKKTEKQNTIHWLPHYLHLIFLATTLFSLTLVRFSWLYPHVCKSPTCQNIWCIPAADFYKRSSLYNTGSFVQFLFQTSCTDHLLRAASIRNTPDASGKQQKRLQEWQSLYWMTAIRWDDRIWLKEDKISKIPWPETVNCVDNLVQFRACSLVVISPVGCSLQLWKENLQSRSLSFCFR